MSKYVKDLLTEDLRKRLDGVSEAIVVNVIGMDANANNRLRRELRAKNINLLVFKNSLARRAAQGTELELLFAGLTGSAALVWGAEDIVSLAKVVSRLAGEKQFAPLESRGGVMEGKRLSAAEVAAVSKWPSRPEQLSILSGQILSVGGAISSQLISAGGALASQIDQKAEGAEEEPA